MTNAKREAVVHITKIENGRPHGAAPVQNVRANREVCLIILILILLIMIFPQKWLIPTIPAVRKKNRRCSSCGMTYSEFNRLGKFGCPDCYEAFREEITPLVRRIHGHTKHVGKVPNRGTGVFRTANQIKRLRQHLKKLVQDERYEEAARVRDEIRMLERQLPPQTNGKEE